MATFHLDKDRMDAWELEGDKMQSILYHTYIVPRKWSREEADDIYPASIRFQTGLWPEHRDSNKCLDEFGAATMF